MPFKDISYLEPFCLSELNHLYTFGGGHYEEHLCEMF